MPAKQTPAQPRPPRVAGALDRPAEPLADGASWSGVAASTADSFSAAASDCEMVGSRLNGVRLTGASLERLRLIDVILDDCELSGATLEGASLARVQFNRCRLSGLVGAGVKAQDVRFVDCKMDGSNFRMTAWDRSEWVDCDLRDADFYAAKLAGCAFRHCTLVGLELSKAGCDALDLRGSTVDGIKGAASLAGCVIGSDQVFPLARCLLGALRIRVEDEPPA